MAKTTALLLFLVCALILQIGAASARLPGFAFTRARGRRTPLFWSRRREAWPRTVPPESTVAKVFGLRSELTLWEVVTARNDVVGDAYVGLLKESTAALLNSYSRLGFPFRAWEVKSLFLRAVISAQNAAHQAQLFSQANEACH